MRYIEANRILYSPKGRVYKLRSSRLRWYPPRGMGFFILYEGVRRSYYLLYPYFPNKEDAPIYFVLAQNLMGEDCLLECQPGELPPVAQETAKRIMDYLLDGFHFPQGG